MSSRSGQNSGDNDSQAVATSGSSAAAENNTAAPPAAAPAADRWGMFKGFIIRLLVIYFISSLFRRPQQQTSDKSGSPSPTGTRMPSTNMFMKGSQLDMFVFFSEDELTVNFSDKSSAFWHKKGLMYGDWESGPNKDGSYHHSGQIQTPPNLMKNGSLYIHLFIVKSGSSPNPSDKSYSKKYIIHASKMMSKYKSRKVSTTVNLLTGSSEAPKVENPNNLTKLPPTPHWHPNLTVQLLDDHSHWTEGAVPPPLNEFIKFHSASNEYYPVLFLNDYWNLQQDYHPVNETTPILNVSLTYSPISLLRWQLYAAQTMRNKWYSNILGEGMMEESDEEQDTLKKTLVETNPYLLALTVVVSLVHSVFEFLAFKNDIQFWHKRENLEGLSVRSVFFNVFQSVIVVLYVLDNDTNFVVRVSVFIGLLIEIWKIKKVIKIERDPNNFIIGRIPAIHFHYNHTYSETETKKYDQLAFRYLSWLLFPLLGIYAVYSLVYQEHRGWYSWVLNMMYGFLLTFGFIMMTPQLFINYKLKSVAHLPWRMLTYKALNTFIDDIFAFVIKMPTLYRLGCLRDDVIFFIYLYQRWIYPMDPTRLNEFGTSKELLEQHKSEPNAAAISNGGGEHGDSGEAAVSKEEPKKTK